MFSLRELCVSVMAMVIHALFSLKVGDILFLNVDFVTLLMLSFQNSDADTSLI